MKKRSIQFQKGLRLAEFQRRYGSAEVCRDAVARRRWPSRFVCPECGNTTFGVLRRRWLYQCPRCHRQTAVTAGTLFHATKLPLSTWFLALYLVTQGNKGMSSLADHSTKATLREGRPQTRAQKRPARKGPCPLPGSVSRNA